MKWRQSSSVWVINIPCLAGVFRVEPVNFYLLLAPWRTSTTGSGKISSPPWCRPPTDGGSGSSWIFRPWAVRGTSRFYFGRDGDWPVPGDYTDDGTEEVVIFRSDTGLWAVKNMTRVYFGKDSDWPIPADYDGEPGFEPGIFREDPALWAIKDAPRLYYGAGGDIPLSR